MLILIPFQLYNANTKKKVNLQNLQDEIFIGVWVPFQTFENHKNKQKQKQMQQQSQMTNGYSMPPFGIPSPMGMHTTVPNYTIPYSMPMSYPPNNIQLMRNTMVAMQKSQGLPSPLPNVNQNVMKQFENQRKQNLPKK